MDGAKIATTLIAVEVIDRAPRRVLYVLTEDCETFDGGDKTGNYGERACYGNADNVMGLDEYRIQMMDKPARMNAIAEKWGACWTHFWCVPQRMAVSWAVTSADSRYQDSWRQLLHDLDVSIEKGCRRHDYATHIHFDYEPASGLPPQPRLVYDVQANGILPADYWSPATNPRHRWHDWDGSARGNVYVKALGDLNTLDSKAGSLRRYQRYLALRQVGYREPLIARTGSFDFGENATDQLASTKAYLMNGLWANSDADFHGRNLSSPAGHMYWARPEDRFGTIENLDQASLLQLAVVINTNFDSTSDVNDAFRNAWKRLGSSGIQVISTMTHAMFMRGAPDPFRSLDGASFSVLDEHLAWVTGNFPEVEFRTATEALVEYIDYYTPELRVIPLPRPIHFDIASRTVQYEYRVLGKHIVVNADHPMTVQVFAPQIFDGQDISEMQVLVDGSVVGAGLRSASNMRPHVPATLSRHLRRLTVTIRLSSTASELLEVLQRITGTAG
jgi:hypothetical protein